MIYTFVSIKLAADYDHGEVHKQTGKVGDACRCGYWLLPSFPCGVYVFLHLHRNFLKHKLFVVAKTKFIK